MRMPPYNRSGLFLFSSASSRGGARLLLTQPVAAEWSSDRTFGPGSMRKIESLLSSLASLGETLIGKLFCNPRVPSTGLLVDASSDQRQRRA
jgi:hypothetical protein